MQKVDTIALRPPQPGSFEPGVGSLKVKAHQKNDGIRRP